MTPYCQHPGCHDSRTNSYATGYGNQTHAVAGAPHLWMFFGAVAGLHVLCRIHALETYRCAIGGAR